MHRHAFDQIQKRAEASNPEAQTVLASCYELGRNVKPSRAETIHWLKLAADQGYAPAEYELGRIYLYGRGIPADYQQALLWEKKAALQGNRNAQRDLAFMYERGLGVQPDPREAALWNRKAAEQDEPQAQLHLAEALESGNGVPVDLAEAKVWYLKAARQNLSKAQLRIAQLYAQETAGTCGSRLAAGSDHPRARPKPKSSLPRSLQHKRRAPNCRSSAGSRNIPARRKKTNRKRGALSSPLRV